jgi:four helix bundle protein
MENIIVDKTFNFALDIVDYCELLESKRKYVIAKQLLRSGTSVGANVSESQSPHSKADFVAKMIIAMKEAEESKFWLKLCKYSKNYDDPGKLTDDIEEIIKILGKIISSSKRK